MTLVHESAGDRARAGVQVLVAAPRRKIRPPFVQIQLDVADRVSQVEADPATVLAGKLTDRGHVENLARVILHAGQQQQRRPLALALEQGGEVVDVQDLVLARLPLQQVFSGIVAAHADLRRGRVTVRRERGRLDHDPAALPLRRVKARHQQVQVDRQRVHRDDFRCLRTGQCRERRGCMAVVGDPRARRLEVAVHAASRPFREFFNNVLRGKFRLQAERITAEIDNRAAAAFAGKLEAVAKAGERILFVEPGREFGGIVVVHQSWPVTW